MDFVAIVSPNHVHFQAAKAVLTEGFNVVCDKPMTVNTEEAKRFASLVEETGLLFALTHNYIG